MFTNSHVIYLFPATEHHQERPKVTKFVSGDDLDDDFNTNTGPEEKSSQAKIHPDPESKTSHVKPTKKQDPKVVNFVG